MSRRTPPVVSLEHLARVLAGRPARMSAKTREKRRRAWKRRQKRIEAERRERRKAKPRRYKGNSWPKILPLAGQYVLAARMEPGQWYARPELRALIPEYASGSVRVYLHQRLMPFGLIERAVNPDFDHGRPGRRQSEALYLYRLSSEGETLAAEWRKAIGEA